MTHDSIALARVWTAAGPAVFVGLYFFIGLLAYGVRCGMYGRFRDAEIEARGSSILLGNWARTYFAWVMRPVWQFLYAADIPPNAVTSVSVLLAVAAGVAVAAGRFSLGGWLYLCSGACDFLDGRLARFTGKTSPSGAALDSILDRYSEGAMLLGLAWYYRFDWVLLPTLAFLAGSFLVPYVRARGEGLGLHLKVGLMQRPERVVILGLATAFSPLVELWTERGNAQPQFYGLTVLVVTILAVSTQFTAAHRLVAVTTALNERAGIRPVRIPRARWLGELTISSTALVTDFLLAAVFVYLFGCTPWVATACGAALGTLVDYMLQRGYSLVESTSRARFVVVGAGSILLSAGGVAVLMLVPTLGFWLAWIIVRVGVLCAWNYPMRWNSQQVSTQSSAQ